MSPPAEPANKRRRTALACNACRTRKSRCDGKRPNCTACIQSSLECIYEASESSTNIIVAKEYVADLETRLRKMERALLRHDDLLLGHLTACVPPTTAMPFRSALADEPDNQDNDDNDDDGAEDQPQGTDGLAITFVDEQTPVYFGESSTIRLVRTLTDAMSAIWNVSKPQHPSTPAESKKKSNLPDAHQTPPQSVAEASELPPGDRMEDMLRVFFNTPGLVFPVFHEPTFWVYYKRFKDSGYTRIGRPWLGMLNMMFAMATNVGSAGERLDQSLVYYHRAVALCGSLSLRVESMESVQYLLLQVLYLQGTRRSAQAWNIHGLLVRSALALGLHVEQPEREQRDPIQYEMRRRTWHAIYCLDKVLSATFGRPCAVPETYMDQLGEPQHWPPSPSPITAKETKSMQQQTDFMRASLQVYLVLGQSLAEQYRDNLGGRSESSDDDASKITTAKNLRKSIGMLRKGPQAIMTFVEPGAKELTRRSNETRLRLMFTLRVRNVEIMIHRPLICSILQRLSKRPSIDSKTQRTMSEAIFGFYAAEATIEIVHDVLAAGDNDGYLGVWFFTLHYGKRHCTCSFEDMPANDF